LSPPDSLEYNQKKPEDPRAKVKTARRRIGKNVSVKPEREKAARNAFGAAWSSFGEALRLGMSLVRNAPELARYWPETLAQVDKYIKNTLPLGLYIGFFSGFGSAIQFTDRALKTVPYAVAVNSIFRTGIIALFPCILGLVLAGKVGSAQAAEIGSMKISDQVDALKTLAINPVGYLGWPRVAAALIMVPVVTVFSDLCSVLTFYLGSLVIHPIPAGDFIQGLKANFSAGYMLVHIILKPALFGFVISFISYFYGLRAQEGAKGIGLASTKAMVVASMLIIALNGVI
jgi:phospholipid/cholesterol/gamma-HCH transport system permease protein